MQPLMCWSRELEGGSSCGDLAWSKMEDKEVGMEHDVIKAWRVMVECQICLIPLSFMRKSVFILNQLFQVFNFFHQNKLLRSIITLTEIPVFFCCY